MSTPTPYLNYTYIYMAPSAIYFFLYRLLRIVACSSPGLHFCLLGGQVEWCLMKLNDSITHHLAQCLICCCYLEEHSGCNELY